jgi:DNA-binding transcriptional regulator YdaS (Cro superfamily)
MEIIMTPLEKAIAKAGSSEKLAQALGLETPMAVSHWKRRGRVPDVHLLGIYRLTGVTPHELRPDIHPTPISGLAAEDISLTSKEPD